MRFAVLLAFMLGANYPLRWIPPPEPDVAGYRVYLGSASMSYAEGIDIGFHAADPNNVASFTLTGLEAGVTRWVVMTAYDTSGNESAFSNEIMIQPGASDAPGAPTLED